MKVGLTCSKGRRSDGSLHPDAAAYVRALEKTGAQATLLPNDEGSLDELLADVAAVVVSGGVDVDVALYGGRREHRGSQAASYRPARDHFEIALLRATRARGIPTLCICRGMQIANVAFGGTLVEDIREEYAERHALEHRHTDALGNECEDYAPGHDVTLGAHSELARLIGRTRFRTNSMHHQAVRALGAGLAAAGRTDDGLIEAVEASFAHPFFFGVQWHPEALDDAVSLRLFDGLTSAARAADALRPGA